MAIRLIVTDLDGTFLNSNHITIPEENIKAFKKAHEMGIKLALASGRTKVLAGYLTEQLPFLDYIITSNGATAYDLKADREIASMPVEYSQAVEIFDILKDYQLPYEIYFNGDCYMNPQSYALFDEKHVAPNIYHLLKNFLKEVPSLEKLLDGRGMEKLNVLSLSAKERAELEEKLGKIGEFAFVSSFPKAPGVTNGNLELTHINATKGFAVKSIARSLGIENNEIMCFGDGENDCSMLELTEYSFAMENGSDYAKSCAKHITDTNDNGGVAKAINKYVFGE